MSALPVTVTTKDGDPRALYLRRELGASTMPDGRHVEFAMSGASLILTIGTFEGGEENRVVQILGLSDLAEAWMKAVDEAKL